MRFSTARSLQHTAHRNAQPSTSRSAPSNLSKSQQRRRIYRSVSTASRKMATAYHIQVPATNTGLLKFNQPDETAQKTSELLQKDLENHHVFFNKEGFHNHIVHHLLSLYGTGANSSEILKGYQENDSYQRPVLKTRTDIADALAEDWATHAPKYLGTETRYPDFLLFFQREIAKSDWQTVLNEFVFKQGDPRAEDLLQRMFAGFLHPLIQLMYGVEWEQPAIVAEALAQAAVHKNQLKGFLEEAEAVAGRDARTPMPPVAALYGQVRDNDKLFRAAHLKDANKIYDGVLKRAPDEMMEVVTKVKVGEDELEERTAEMFEAAVWVASGAALRPTKQAKFDFFLIHHVNSAPFFVKLNQQAWLSRAAKVRILEWKIRMDLVQYAARAVPKINFGMARSYKPQDLDEGRKLVATPQELLPRFHNIMDDGHTIKVVRALDICRDVCTPYDGKSWRKINDDETWLKLHYMVLDSSEHVKEASARWIRSAGFDELWDAVPDRK